MTPEQFKSFNLSFEDGFSSQDEYQQPRLVSQLRISHSHTQQYNRNFLAPPIEIISKQYSLTPDISTGWAPKFSVPTPIPLYFQNQSIDGLVNIYLQNMAYYPNLKLCYCGPRYQSTYFAYLNKQFQFPYKIMQKLSQPQNAIKKTTPVKLFQKNQSDLQFDSAFQSGNLDYAFKIEKKTYELYMRVDSNTRGHFQWFNFKVRKMQKGQRYYFSIGNFQKNNLLYVKNAQPFIFSKRAWEQNKTDWKQGGDDIKFKRIIPKINCVFQEQQQQEEYFQQEKYFHLQFSYQNQYQDDQVQFAYCIPYTYSYMLERMNQFISANQTSNTIKSQKLCNSLGGLQIPVITITSNIQQEQKATKRNRKIKKQIIMVSGRLHPGQSNGSFMIQGFISSLLQNNQWASKLREAYIFKIIPMVNPDGVVLGNYRTGISGKDLNRQFIDPDRQIFPEVVALKGLVQKYRNLYGSDFFLYLDFHGHSLKKNIFMYGPDFPIMSKFYYECRVFPKIISQQTTMFRYHSCSFQLSKFKQSTIRGVLLKHFNITFVYTIQASNGLYKDIQNSQDSKFDKQSWKTAGVKMGLSLYKYTELLQRYEEQKKLKQEQKATLKRKRYQYQSFNRRTKSSYKPQTIFSKTCLSFNKSIQKQKDKTEKLKDAAKYWKAQLMEDSESLNKIEKNSEDQISQGFSDRQGSQNDFDKKKMQQLILRIKFKDRSKEDIQKELERQNIEHRIKKCATQMQQAKNQANESQAYHIFRKKNHKKQIFLNKKKFKKLGNEINSVKAKAKIINFTFGLSKSLSQVYQTVGRQPKIFVTPSKISDSLSINKRSLNFRTLQKKSNPFKLNFSNSYQQIDRIKQKTSLDHRSLYINNIKEKKNFL